MNKFIRRFLKMSFFTKTKKCTKEERELLNNARKRYKERIVLEIVQFGGEYKFFGYTKNNLWVKTIYADKADFLRESENFLHTLIKEQFEYKGW